MCWGKALWQKLAVFVVDHGQRVLEWQVLRVRADHWQGLLQSRSCASQMHSSPMWNSLWPGIACLSWWLITVSYKEELHLEDEWYKLWSPVLQLILNPLMIFLISFLYHPSPLASTSAGPGCFPGWSNLHLHSWEVWTLGHWPWSGYCWSNCMFMVLTRQEAPRHSSVNPLSARP